MRVKLILLVAGSLLGSLLSGSEDLSIHAAAYRIELDYRGEETLVDFPLLVALDGSRVEMQDFEEASQLAFYGEDGVRRLAWEVETFDSEGASNIWVHIPDSSSRGHPLDFSEGRPLTFSAWVSPEGRGVTQTGSTALSGTILAKRFSSELEGVFDLHVQYQFAIHASGRAEAGNLTESWRLRQSWGDDPKSNYSEYLTSILFQQGDWYHVAVVCDDWHRPRPYVNGRPYEGWHFHKIEEAFIQNPYIDVDVSLGGYWAYYDEERKEKLFMYGFHGRMDEVRMESVARSGDWIRAQYRSQIGEFRRFERVEEAEFRNGDLE